MKLFHTHNSPYARRIRVAIRETGLLERIEEIDVHPIPDNLHRLLEQGASGKVPMLITDDGRTLCETLIIARYLDGLCGGALYSPDPSALSAQMEIEGLASALMDTLFVRSHENRRDAALRSQEVITKERSRAERLYDALEQRVPELNERVQMDTISVGCALGYADGRHPDDSWRNGRERLRTWYDWIMQRPAMAETIPAF